MMLTGVSRQGTGPVDHDSNDHDSLVLGLDRETVCQIHDLQLHLKWDINGRGS
jgi:hypothetical protein